MWLSASTATPLTPWGEQGGPAGVHAVAESLLNAALVVQPVAVDDLDDQMRAGKHDPVAPDEVIIAVFVEHVAWRIVRGDETPDGGVFLMGACIQTVPQLEEVGVFHGAPLLIQ